MVQFLFYGTKDISSRRGGGACHCLSAQPRDKHKQLILQIHVYLTLWWSRQWNCMTIRNCFVLFLTKLFQPPRFLIWSKINCQEQVSSVGHLLSNPLVKTTLRSKARHRRAIARHSGGTCISSWTLQSHLCFTSVTLVIHLFLSHSHVFQVAGWCSGWGSCFVIRRSQVRILITPHAAGGGELSTHRPQLALPQLIRGSAK